MRHISDSAILTLNHSYFSDEEKAMEIYNIISRYNLAKKKKHFDLFKFIKKQIPKE